ncbi:uncharacterized protein M6B38_389625 [Iris pallida]|uniref:Uncharacterized protein n=1 Tax=Iris pallida TaxID=29817 RepID=A0AAX6G0T1_IRIPA|nr:uncharacterized protein M6B38_389625 [Iris pallida]
MRYGYPSRHHCLLLLHHRRIHETKGQGHETGRKPLFHAHTPTFRSRPRRPRLPLPRTDPRHHHHPPRKEEDKLKEKPSCFNHTLSPFLVTNCLFYIDILHTYIANANYEPTQHNTTHTLQDQFRAGSNPVRHRIEHEQPTALRQRVDGRGVLRRQGRHIRRRSTTGRRRRALHNHSHLHDKGDETTTHRPGRGKTARPPRTGQITAPSPDTDTDTDTDTSTHLVIEIFSTLAKGRTGRGHRMQLSGWGVGQ